MAETPQEKLSPLALVAFVIGTIGLAASFGLPTWAVFCVGYFGPLHWLLLVKLSRGLTFTQGKSAAEHGADHGE